MTSKLLGIPIFLAGMVACANLVVIFGYNKNYEGSPVKAGIALFFAIAFSLAIPTKRGTQDDK